ncbi:MAG: FAD:protein FMN transferase [bacterium]
MKIRPINILLIVLLIIVGFWRTSLWLTPQAEKTAYIMGSPVRVKIEGPNAPQLANQALAEIRRLDELFSTYKPQSEISRLNAEAKGINILLSDDTNRILADSIRISNLTNGAFNIYLKNGIDLGGIGKGYALESARTRLMKLGAKSGIIDMRSSVVVFGAGSWEVGVQHPRDKGKLLGEVTLTGGQSLSTSGDYERGQHIVDPRTGKPAKLCQSVTVIGTNAAETDALSTAIFVLGPTEGMALANKLGVQVLIVDQEGKIYDNFGFKLW